VPAPIPDPLAEAGTDRILEDVAADTKVVVLRLEHLRPEPSLEDVAHLSVARVESHRVEPVEGVHPFGDVRVRRLHDEVVVVRHQAVRVDRPASCPRHLAEELGEELAVVVTAVDRRAAHAPRHHVVDPVMHARPRESSHASTVRRSRGSTGVRTAFGTLP
jgi:hypothetical protein